MLSFEVLGINLEKKFQDKIVFKRKLSRQIYTLTFLYLQVEVHAIKHKVGFLPTKLEYITTFVR